MACGLRRKIRLDSRRDNQKNTRNENGVIKAKERVRRDIRIIEKIKATSNEDYSPEVKSWISAATGKTFRQVTADDIKQLIA